MAQIMKTGIDHSKRLAELIERHRLLYADSQANKKLDDMIALSPHSGLSKTDIRKIFHQARAVFFDTHVEVVSGHHTESYLRFESIAPHPDLISMIVQDMARWIQQLRRDHQIRGILVPASDAFLLAEGIVNSLQNHIPLRMVLAPFDLKTGRIGTEVSSQSIREGEHFLVLNDVTTRGNCVSKLGQIVSAHGGIVAGMMVFARRDSGQFPLMDELTVQYPFYYGASLHMPQWEATDCWLCRDGAPLFSWKEMPGEAKFKVKSLKLKNPVLNCNLESET
jgi:orotate phosphoribosyltransferase